MIATKGSIIARSRMLIKNIFSLIMVNLKAIACDGADQQRNLP